MRRVLMPILLWALSLGLACAQLPDQQMVEHAFPSGLDHGDDVRYSRFVTSDLNRDGHPLIVAVYTNGAGGAIRVLNRAGQVLAAPNVPGMRGFHATVQAVDLDADGVPEILAELTTGHSPDNPDTWVFRWTANDLQLISPTCAVGNLQLTCLGHVSLLDLNGDGHLSLLDWPAFAVNSDTGAVTADGGWSIYTLANGRYQKVPQTFQYAREFRRGSGAPFTSEKRFAATPGTATLRIINGTGANAATSGHVMLNGKEIVGADDFKRGQHVYEVPVTLVAQNTLTVRLDGKPGSAITVLVLTSN